MSDFGPFVVEHVSRSVFKERSASGKLVIFHIEDGQDETIAQWASAVKDELTRWPSGHPCLLLHDLHKTGISAFGAYIRDDFQRLYQLRPDLKRYVGIVMPAGSEAEIAQLDVMVRELKAKIGYPVHWEVFTDREGALAWLLNKLS
jgi:hypothetical protein